MHERALGTEIVVAIRRQCCIVGIASHCDAQIDEPAQHLAHLREVVEQIVELDDQRQEVVALQSLPAAAVRCSASSKLCARCLDGLQAERGSFTLDA